MVAGSRAGRVMRRQGHVCDCMSRQGHEQAGSRAGRVTSRQGHEQAGS